MATTGLVTKEASAPSTASKAEEPIQALWDAYKSAERAWEAISSAADKMRFLARKHHPKRPENLYGRRPVIDRQRWL